MAISTSSSSSLTPRRSDSGIAEATMTTSASAVTCNRISRQDRRRNSEPRNFICASPNRPDQIPNPAQHMDLKPGRFQLAA